jgi:hypothetical protein
MPTCNVSYYSELVGTNPKFRSNKSSRDLRNRLVQHTCSCCSPVTLPSILVLLFTLLFYNVVSTSEIFYDDMGLMNREEWWRMLSCPILSYPKTFPRM